MDYRDPEWAAERLGVDKNTLYKFLHEGTIPAIQLGRKWLISEARLVGWLEEETDRQTRARRSSIRLVDRALKQMSHLSSALRALLREAYGHARRLGHRHLGLEHVLLAMSDSKHGGAHRLARRLGIDIAELNIPSRDPETPSDPPIRRLGRKPLARRAMRLAVEEANGAGSKHVEPEHMLLGVLRAADREAVPMLAQLKITPEKARRELKALQSTEKEES